MNRLRAYSTDLHVEIGSQSSSNSVQLGNPSVQAGLLPRVQNFSDRPAEPVLSLASTTMTSRNASRLSAAAVSRIARARLLFLSAETSVSRSVRGGWVTVRRFFEDARAGGACGTAVGGTGVVFTDAPTLTLVVCTGEPDKFIRTLSSAFRGVSSVASASL
jgi:hypothetical protein